jgi:hypothetical protein
MPRLLLLLLFSTSTLVSSAQLGAGKPLSVLFIGNSLTAANNLPSIVESLAEAGGHKRPQTHMVAVGGFSLEDHWQQGEARRAIARGPAPLPGEATPSTPVTGESLRASPATGRWDVVVLQQGPSAAIESRRLLIQFARLFAEVARGAGAKPALYMVWPSTDRRQDFGGVSQSYRRAAEEVNALLLPAGDAWRVMLQRDSRLKLYSPDGLHPTQAGSYLAALVIYEGLYGTTCVGLPAIGVSAAEARALQEVASEAGRRTP